MAPPLAAYLLMPDFAEFARRHPDIELDIQSSGELANLTNREADVAVRVVYDRRTLPLNLHGLKGPELFGGEGETRKTKRVRLFTDFISRRLAAYAPLLGGPLVVSRLTLRSRCSRRGWRRAPPS